MRPMFLLSGLVLAGTLLAVAPAAANAASLRQSALISASVQLPSIVSAVPVNALPTLAQASDDSSSGGSTRVRTRGIGKLIGLVVVGLLAAGKFIIGMFTGKGGDE